MILPDAKRTLNFALAAEPRSGAAALATALNHDTGPDRVWCHLGLLHESANIRLKHHTDYFQDDKLDALVEWFRPGHGLISPQQYLSHFIFDNPRRQEAAIGCYIPMTAVRQWELTDYLSARCREGDFCVILVHRNDAATFVSLKQASATQRWTRHDGLTCDRSVRPGSIRVEAEELTTHCRTARATRDRLRAACTDLYEITYLDILQRFNATVQSVLEFLEVPGLAVRATAALRRLHDRDMPDRVSNYRDLLRSVPRDVADLLTAEDFI